METKKKENRIKNDRQDMFFRGIASAFDLSGRSGIVKISRKSDAENLRSDWERIGSDFYTAIHKVRQTVTR